MLKTIFYLHIARRLLTLGALMAIHAHRKGEESNDSLLQRWKKQVQNTGLMKVLRTRSNFTKQPSKRMVRQSAIKREEYRAKNRRNQFYSNM